MQLKHLIVSSSGSYTCLFNTSPHASKHSCSNAFFSNTHPWFSLVSFLSSSKNNPKSLLTFLTLLVLLLLLLLSVPCQSVHGVFPCLVCPPVITAPPTQHGKLKKMLVWLCTCDLRHGWGVCGKEWNIFTFPTQDMVVTSVNVKDSKQ